MRLAQYRDISLIWRIFLTIAAELIEGNFFLEGVVMMMVIFFQMNS